MKRIALAFCALLMLIPAAAPAAAGFESKVKIRSDDSGDPPGMRRNYYPYFRGTVASSKEACETKRMVSLYRIDPGADVLVGSDETNARGKWQIVLDKPNTNDFFARVEQRQIGSGKCRADRSPDFHHDPFD